MAQENIKKKLLERLEQIKTFDTPVYVVTFKGRRLKMASGKSSWHTITAAKNGLRNNCHIDRGYLEVLKELENEGIIEYIKL